MASDTEVAGNQLRVTRRTGEMGSNGHALQSADDDTGKEVNDVLSDAEAHAFLRLRPGTLARWRMEGRGPAWSRLGRRVAYLRSDLLAFIAANRVEPTVTV
jgi:hypothetical protein